jgi:hypothetical protein
MKGIKIIYLLLALALPVFVFLFLKYFGQNQFDVEPLFTEAMPMGFRAECNYAYELPYSIPEHILQDMEWSSRDSLTLFYFTTVKSSATALNRIQEEHLSSEVHIVELSEDSRKPEALDSLGLITSVERSEIAYVKKCFLFIDEPNNLLLVDNQRKIRGIYQAENRDEIDRLLLEVKIILKKY